MIHRPEVFIRNLEHTAVIWRLRRRRLTENLLRRPDDDYCRGMKMECAFLTLGASLVRRNNISAGGLAQIDPDSSASFSRGPTLDAK